MFTFALLPSSSFFFLLYVMYKYTANHALLIVPLHKRRASAARPRLPPFAPALIPRSSSSLRLLLLLRRRTFGPSPLHYTSFLVLLSLPSTSRLLCLQKRRGERERGDRPLFPLSFILVPFPSLCIEPQRTRQLGEEGWRRDQGKERPPILQPKRGSFEVEFSSIAVSIGDRCIQYDS